MPLPSKAAVTGTRWGAPASIPMRDSSMFVSEAAWSLPQCPLIQSREVALIMLLAPREYCGRAPSQGLSEATRRSEMSQSRRALSGSSA
jgi:hypothetical protein